MSRLPVPGSDDNTWGTILNDYLSVELNSDGTLKVRTDGSVVTTSGDQSIAGVKTFASSPKVPAPSTGSDAANKTYVDARTFAFTLSTYSKQGSLAVAPGTIRMPIDGTYTIVNARVMVGTAPTGADIVVDINKNGSTIFTTQANRPRITAGTNSSGASATPDITALAANDYLTVDIDQIGSGTPGSDLSVVVTVSKTIS
jgi:hypothetical protein